MGDWYGAVYILPIVHRSNSCDKRREANEGKSMDIYKAILREVVLLK